MMAFTSLIPVVGTAVIWVPAVVYLVLVQSWGKALFLAIWSMLVVGSIDNFLRPFLMKGEGGISSIYLFFAILGGINLFGLVGILYGPLILGVAAILLHLYEHEYSEMPGRCYNLSLSQYILSLISPGIACRVSLAAAGMR
jgi:predicted PurR-regulated permease PerM